MIGADGAVTGTLKYVEGWTAFNESDISEQSGHFFPLKLDEKYSGKQITCTGTKTKTSQDLEWVLRVADSSSKFTFSTDEDGTFLTLDFSGAELQPNMVSLSAGNKSVKKATRKKSG